MERFWNKVKKTEGCWEWTACCGSDGYGKYGYEGKLIKANRFSYMMTHPLTIDLREHPKLLVCHKCDNPKCVNPSHLFLGTHADNMRDMHEKGRGIIPKGEKQGLSKLTEQQVLEIREKYAKGNITQKKLAEEYGVTEPCIRYIINRHTWKHI